jgi:hypothetical protein
MACYWDRFIISSAIVVEDVVIINNFTDKNWVLAASCIACATGWRIGRGPKSTPDFYLRNGQLK